MNDIKILNQVEGKLTFEKLDANTTIIYKDNNVKIGTYNANIEDIKSYCISNNIDAEFKDVNNKLKNANILTVKAIRNMELTKSEFLSLKKNENIIDLKITALNNCYEVIATLKDGHCIIFYVI